MTSGILINIDVDDLQRATAFYTALFELRIGRRFGACGVELVGGAVPFYLLVKPAGSIASPASSGERRHYGRHWTPVHLDFVVADVDAAVDGAGRRRDAGRSRHYPCAGAHRPSRRPVRQRLLPLQFLGRGYDEIASG